MDKAKAAVSHFVSKSGHHDTTVHESTAPAVQQERVIPTRHEETQQAIDREIHQDHHHTTVQPVHDKEVRPEEHHHRMADVQHKEFNHGDREHTDHKLRDVASQFQSTREVHDTQVTQGTAPTVEGERVHHHVHETVQPVVHKETITPEVVHTTVPIHETHHAAAEHHGTSVLPAKHISDFTSSGGDLKGGRTSEGYYEGCPRPYDDSLKMKDGDLSFNSSHQGVGSGHHGVGSEHQGVGSGHHGVGSEHQGVGSGHHGVGSDRERVGGSGYDNTSGPHSSDTANRVDPRVDSDRDGRAGIEGEGHRGDQYSSRQGNQYSQMGTDSSRGGHDVGRLGTTDESEYGSGTTGQHKKPSMMDKLNPQVDSNNDGKAGFMK